MIHAVVILFNIFSGNVNLWGLAKLFECIRVIALLHPDFMDWTSLYHEYTLFVVVCNFKIDRQFYQRTKNMRFRTPIKLSVEVRGMTKTSLLCHSIIKDANSDQIFATLDFRYVLVDKKTRKGRSPPEWFRLKYGALVAPDSLVKSLHFYPPNVPNDPAFVYPIRVAFSDIDQNGHTNNSTYIRYCSDCAVSAATLGKLSNFKHDIAQRRAKSMQLFYAQETTVNEWLRVSVWQQDDRNTLYFQVYRDGSEKSIFHAVIQYYALVESKI